MVLTFTGFLTQHSTSEDGKGGNEFGSVKNLRRSNPIFMYESFLHIIPALCKGGNEFSSVKNIRRSNPFL
jgi:hypothetical protein